MLVGHAGLERRPEERAAGRGARRARRRTPRATPPASRGPARGHVERRATDDPSTRLAVIRETRQRRARRRSRRSPRRPAASPSPCPPTAPSSLARYENEPSATCMLRSATNAVSRIRGTGKLMRRPPAAAPRSGSRRSRRGRRTAPSRAGAPRTLRPCRGSTSRRGRETASPSGKPDRLRDHDAPFERPRSRSPIAADRRRASDGRLRFAAKHGTRGCRTRNAAIAAAAGTPSCRPEAGKPEPGDGEFSSRLPAPSMTASDAAAATTARPFPIRAAAAPQPEPRREHDVRRVDPEDERPERALSLDVEPEPFSPRRSRARSAARRAARRFRALPT